MVARTGKPTSWNCLWWHVFLLADRSCLVVLLINFLDGSWIVEQPSSSLMLLHPAALHACREGCYRINTFLGAYRHWCAKLCAFFSNKLPSCTFNLQSLLLLHLSVCYICLLGLMLLRLWVGGLYRKFDKRRKKLSEQKRRHLGYPKPTTKHANGTVSGSSSLRTTQLPGFNCPLYKCLLLNYPVALIVFLPCMWYVLAAHSGSTQKLWANALRDWCKAKKW